MLEINEVTINRILNPTSIDLGEYVINPYVGCEFACTYCYVRSNKTVTRRKMPWGSYVDIKVNAPDLLEKEILEKHPGTVLLGSTTECFQPVEKEFRLTWKMLEILNRHKVSYVILTRSPCIAEYIPLLNQGFCKRIYFTVNKVCNTFKQLIEPKSPPLDSRNDAIQKLLDAGISVIPYYSPVIPWVTDIRDAFSPFAKAERIEFEYLNFNLPHARDMVRHISLAKPALRIKFTGMWYEKGSYDHIWDTLDEAIARQAREANKKYKIYRHPYGEFFQNTYFS
ncbi:MAG: hypothetical protein AYP45_16350 [Candidatus Brocadia carolinensis]|uniref:Radical SAM core domain-containing protein n=1 Tax=Candidatus Brocadia carolinensis TaxID=1004156 RepID=A0A1V4APY5_9BACT|nr:MAG: hypothetical protein AYP45_16350 [Candidatus Brocadia caroliniensis]